MSALRYVNINGTITDYAMLPADNSAFRYGAGLFETMLVQEGNIRLWQYHWERLSSGLSTLNFSIPVLFTSKYLHEEILRIVKKNNSDKLCRVRMQVYGGSGGIFGPEDTKPQFVIECYHLDQGILDLNINGLVVDIAQGLYKSNDSLANLKSANALIYATAARQARQNKWNDALIRNTAGNIMESTIANVFWIKDDKIFTPPLEDGCVAGVMRRHLMDTSDGIGEQSLTEEALLAADEVFLTNAIRGIRWIGSFRSATFGNRITKSIFAACAADQT